MTTCTVDGCFGELVARGLCRKHYARWSRRGTIEIPDTSPEARFWKYVNKDAPTHPIHGQCWEWTGGKFRRGYGAVTVGSKTIKAHRFSWQLHFGAVPRGAFVLHKCDNPSCVNPLHLFTGTHTDNVNDRDQKERQCRGHDVHTAVLTEEQVLEIRARYTFGSSLHGSTALAKEFNVSYQTILRVVKRIVWKHV